MKTSRNPYRIALIVLALFSVSAVLYTPALFAKTKKRAARQETVKQEEKDEPAEQEGAAQADRGDVKEGDRAASEEDAAVQAAQDTVREATEGAPGGNYGEDDFRPQVEEESSAWMFIKMMLVLGIFAGGFYYFYRFVTKRAGVSVFGGEAIKVLSAIPLGQNKSLQLIDCAGKVLVVGVSDSAIGLITEITEKDQIDRIRILATRTPPPQRGAGGFQEEVMNEIGKIIGRVKQFRTRGRGQARMEVVDNPADIEYLRRQRSRLKDMDGTDSEQ